MVKLYVGNLPYSTDDQRLREIFEEFGSVESATVIIDRDTKRSRGFGFVEMSDEAGAMRAIETLHNKDEGGRRLIVNEARPRDDRPRRSGPGGGGNGGPRRHRN